MRRHEAPWVALRLAERKAPVACPECQSPLSIELDVKTYNPSTETYGVADAVAFCSGCEFVHEITT